MHRPYVCRTWIIHCFKLFVFNAFAGLEYEGNILKRIILIFIVNFSNTFYNNTVLTFIF